MSGMTGDTAVDGPVGGIAAPGVPAAAVPMSGLSAAGLPSRAVRRARGGRILSPFEFWPGWLFYFPVVAQWILLGLRHGDFSLPAAANPRIPVGGLCGESKTDIFDLAGPEARRWIAPWTSFVTGGDDRAAAEAARLAARLRYPLVVKPDIGCNGTGVRLAQDAAALARALPDYPSGVRLVLQELVPWEGEAGIFYMRRPGEARGRVTSLTLKCAPTVTGDGASTLRALILADRRAGRVPHLYFPRLEGRLDTVPAKGERVRLVFSGNHCKGSVFLDGRAEITPALVERIDAFARDIADFHFGRIDLRYASLAELRRGEGFRVIEVNGVGSEATHIWDPDCTLREAYAAQFFHYRAAFEIGREMKARGVRTPGKWEMLRLWRLQKRLLRSYPLND